LKTVDQLVLSDISVVSLFSRVKIWAASVTADWLLLTTMI